MPSLLELALAHTRAGISIIPISPSGPNGNKEPAFDCSEYLSRRIATPDELREWFAGDSLFGLALVHGAASGGLECLDLLYTAVVRLFRQLVTLQGGADLLGKLSAAREAGQGRTRLYYRCLNPVFGSRQLALFEWPSESRSSALLQLLAGVHGEGTWTELGSRAFCDGSSTAYEWIGHDFTEVPTITESDRQLLLESAACLNAWVEPGSISGPPSPKGFDISVTWEQILVPLRWRKLKDCGEVSLWQSPQRTNPGYCAVSGIGLGRDLLYLIGTEQAYTKFGAFSTFYFDGEIEKARSARMRPASSSRETAAGARYLRAVRKSQPLCSCIMPTTGDRRLFLPQAIKYFQRQTYPNLELLILCDGEDDMSDLVPSGDERIHYSYLGRDRRTLGAKLNLGCERAKGELIAHWDDDDWAHPDRLSFEVGALMAEDVDICSFSQLLFFEIGTRMVWLCRTPALLHPSLYHCQPFGAAYLYRRSYWNSSPFPDVSRDPDMAFTSAEGRQDHSVLVSDYRLYVAMIHGSNTADYSEKSYWTSWSGDLREIMGTDLDFYESLEQS